VNATVRDVRALFATNKLERVKSLRLEGLRGGVPEDFAFIFASLNRLQRLSIRKTWLGDRGLDALITSHAFPDLLALELSETGATNESVFRLAKTIHMPRLRWARVGPFSQGLTELTVYALNKRWPVANASAFE
jgi:hypothetical protein